MVGLGDYGTGPRAAPFTLDRMSSPYGGQSVTPASRRHRSVSDPTAVPRGTYKQMRAAFARLKREGRLPGNSKRGSGGGTWEGWT